MHIFMAAIALAVPMTWVTASSYDCVTVDGPTALKLPAVELLFSGRVVRYRHVGDDAHAYRATFEVDRVWKGNVPAQIDLFVWELQAHMPRYEEDREYVVLASSLTDPRVLAAVGLADREGTFFSPTPCSSLLSPNIRRELGQGSRPATRK